MIRACREDLTRFRETWPRIQDGGARMPGEGSGRGDIYV